MGLLVKSALLLFMATGATAAGAQGYGFLQKCGDGFLGFELALDYCTRAIKSGDLSADSLAIAHYNRGAILSRRRGGLEKALVEFEEAIRLQPGRPAAYVARGALKTSKGDLPAALLDFDQAIRLEPSLAEAYLYRAQIRAKTGEAQATIEDATQALKLEPVGPVVQAGAIAMYTSRPRPADRRPHDAGALKTRATARFHLADFTGAAADFAGTLRFTPADSESALWLFLSRARAKGADGRADLAAHAKQLPEGSWGRRIASVLLEETTPDDLFGAVAEKGLMRQAQRCQAAFYVGEWRLARGESEAAKAGLTRAKERCPENSNEGRAAIADLARLN